MNISWIELDPAWQTDEEYVECKFSIFTILPGFNDILTLNVCHNMYYS